MIRTLVLPQTIAQDILTVTGDKRETAGVLLAHWVETEGGVRLLGYRLHWLPDDTYIRRDEYGMTIRSEGYVPFLAEAESEHAFAMFVHTHPGPGANPRPSKHDHGVDHAIADLFRLRTGSAIYGAAIFSRHETGLTFTATAGPEGDVRVIDRMWIVGDRLRLCPAFDHAEAIPFAVFDRNVRAFGPAIQNALGALHMAVVGCGGTGSAVVEMLVRLGVRRFTLIDPDVLTESNLTRVYGSYPHDIGREKVNVLGRHIVTVAPDAAARLVKGMVTSESVARRLLDCDVVFGCTDDNAGRLVLSRLASYFLVPVIDCGVLLSSGKAGQLTGIDGRVTTMVPGQACLVCRDRVDLRRAASELMTPEERTRLVDEGYAPALGAVEPAVVAYTSLVAATAVSELLERLIGYGPEPTPSEVLLRCHDREISTNTITPRPGHYCDPAAGKLGRGLTTPFLEQTWPQ